MSFFLRFCCVWGVLACLAIFASPADAQNRAAGKYLGNDETAADMGEFHNAFEAEFARIIEGSERSVLLYEEVIHFLGLHLGTLIEELTLIYQADGELDPTMALAAKTDVEVCEPQTQDMNWNGSTWTCVNTVHSCFEADNIWTEVSPQD